MRPFPTRTVPVLLATLLLASLAGCNGIDAERHAAFRGALGDTSISVYPTAVWEPAGPRGDTASAARLAGFLREHALAVPDVATDVVELPREPGRFQQRVWKDSAAAFGRWVVAHPPAGEYALLAEVLVSATPEGRPFVGGLHAFVVDREGRLVDGVLLNSHHEPFRDAAPADVDGALDVLLAVLETDWLTGGAGSADGRTDAGDPTDADGATGGGDTTGGGNTTGTSEPTGAQRFPAEDGAGGADR